MRMNNETAAYAKKQLADEPPVPCDFAKGDQVTFTNEYGAVFSGHTVIGFRSNLTDMLPTSYIHLDLDCYWFPIDPQRLKHEDATKENNGNRN